MHVNEIINLMREYVDEPSEDANFGDYPDSSLIQFLNAEHRHLFSVVRQSYEDWFGKEYIFPVTTGTLVYDIDRNVINPRRVEILSQGVSEVSDSSVSPTYSYYSVDEGSKKFIVVEPQTLNQLEENYFPYTSTNNSVFGGYTLWDRTIRFGNGTAQLNTGNYCRIFHSPLAPALHRATAQGAGDDYLTLGNSASETTLGPIRKINNYYTGCDLEIISGPGAGEIKKIIRHDPITGTVWIDSEWVTNPDSSSVYSINSPIIEDYHELLALGGSMRAKGIKTEDDAEPIVKTYSALLEDLKNSLERRVTQSSRRVLSSRY